MLFISAIAGCYIFLVSFSGKWRVVGEKLSSL